MRSAWLIIEIGFSDGSVAGAGPLRPVVQRSQGKDEENWSVIAAIRRRFDRCSLPLRCLGRYFQSGTRPGGFTPSLCPQGVGTWVHSRHSDHSDVESSSQRVSPAMRV